MGEVAEAPRADYKAACIRDRVEVEVRGRDPADGRGAQRPGGGRRGWEGEGGEGRREREDEGGKEEEAGEKRGEEAQQGPTEAE